MNNIVTSDVLQAVVVDDFDNVQGVISIGDILRFMVYPTDEVCVTRQCIYFWYITSEWDTSKRIKELLLAD